MTWSAKDLDGRNLPSGIWPARLLVPDALGRGVTPEYAKSIKLVSLR